MPTPARRLPATVQEMIQGALSPDIKARFLAYRTSLGLSPHLPKPPHEEQADGGEEAQGP